MKHTRQLMSPLEVHYLCEQFFSGMNVRNNAYMHLRDQLERLESCMIGGSSMLLLVKYGQILLF
jgi:hypothetical protein